MKYTENNILIITYALHRGGMEQSLSRLVNYLNEEQYKVSILLTEKRGEWFDYFNEKFCNVTFLPNSRMGAAFHLLKIRSFIIRSNCSIVFIISDKFSQSILPFLPKYIKVVSAVRSDDPYFYHLATTNQTFVDAFVVNSLKLHDTLKTLINNQPIKIIQNGFSIPDNRIIERRLKFNRPLKLLFVGRLAEEKRVLLLVDIVKKCINLNLEISLNIVGDGSLMAELRSKIKSNNLESIIKIVGPVPNVETQSWYLKSHVLLFTSIAEGLPNVLIEAQGCGCVPISNLLPKITDTVISNKKTGYLIENNNIDQYVDCIKYIYENKVVWEALSNSGIEWIKEKFSEEQEKMKYIKLLNNLTSDQNRKRAKGIPFQIFRLIKIRDWIPQNIKNLKHKLGGIFPK